MKQARRLPKKPTLAALKRKCDKAFSEFIRKRDTDRHGNTSCVTCGARMHWKEIQCGHFVSRTHLSLRFDEKNCNPQCVSCNVFRGGNYPEYAGYLTRTYGHGVIESLLQEKRKTVKFTRSDYEEMINRFTRDAQG